MAESLVFTHEVIIGSADGEHVKITPSGIALMSAGGVRGTFWQGDDTVSISLRDGNGQERLRLLVNDDGTPEVVLSDANGKDRLEVSVDEEGRPAVRLRDPNDEARLSCALLDESVPSLALADEHGDVRFNLVNYGTDEVAMMYFPDDGKRGVDWGAALVKLCTPLHAPVRTLQRGVMALKRACRPSL